MTTPIKQLSKIQVASRRLGWVLVVIHGALFVLAVPYNPDGPLCQGQEEMYVYFFLALDFPLSEL